MCDQQQPLSVADRHQSRHHRQQMPTVGGESRTGSGSAVTETRGGRQQVASSSSSSAVESIPLGEYPSRSAETRRSGCGREIGPAGEAASTGWLQKSDALRQLHAQSSAETSGVGDSLQRIHALSSTETSGYGGDAAQSPTDLASVTSPTASSSAAMTAADRFQSSTETTVWMDALEHQTGSTNHCDSGGGNGNSAYVNGSYAGNGSRWKTSDAASGLRRQSPPTTSRSRAAEYRRALSDERYREAVDYDDDHWDSYSTSSHEQQQQQQCQHHLQQQQQQQRYRPSQQPRRSSTTRIHATANGGRASDAGVGGGALQDDGQFLGRCTQSAWLRWSHERRASYKRKVENLEKRQSELERFRVSSPVRKARQESARFISAALEVQQRTADGTLLSPSTTDDTMGMLGSGAAGGSGGVDACGHPAFPFDIPPPAAAAAGASRKSVRKQQDGGTRGGSVSDTEKLSLAQWNALVAFWEHPVFSRARYAGLLFGFAAVVLGAVSVTNGHWVSFYNHSTFGFSQSGLWQICSLSTVNCTSVEYTKWHIAVIGQLMFTLSFGIVAIALSVCGLCTTSLPRKIYCYHSAGEIHVICALSSGVTLILHVMATDAERQLAVGSVGSGVTLGPGFLFVAGAAAAFASAAVSMCLDDAIRTLTRGLCRRRRNNGAQRKSTMKRLESVQ